MVTHQLSYLYSLTEDKEERAEDKGADDEGARELTTKRPGAMQTKGQMS